MWSPDRPPTRPPRARSFHNRSASSVASLGGSNFTSPPRHIPSSTASDSKSVHSAFADADDDSSCDDTYVSMSSRSRKKESLFEESPSVVLKETSRVTNTRRSPGLPKKKDYSNRHTISRAESSGILDKLKSDINSLDIMRNSSYVEETSVFSGSVFDFDDENKSIASRSAMPKVIERSHSVDRSFRGRDELRGPLVVGTVQTSRYPASGTASVDGSRRIMDRKYSDLRENQSGSSSVGSRRELDRKHNELREKLQKEKMEMHNKSMVDRSNREMHLDEKDTTICKLEATIRELRKEVAMEKDENRCHLETKLYQKDEKISKLQEMIRGLKKEVVMEKDENEQLKSKLEECQSKEADTQNALREVMKNVEYERDVREKEMQLASKVQGAEVLMLEEKLDELKREDSAKMNALRDEISEKSGIIDGLKRDINQLRTMLDNSTRSKADSDKTLRSQIERLEMRLDNETEDHRKKVAELNKTEEEWSKKYNVLEARLEEQNKREAEWTDQLSVTRLELENLRAYSTALENQNQYLKESSEGLQNLERDYDELKHYQAESERTIDDLRKELEVAHKAKTEFARQVEVMKATELERDEYVSKMEDSLEELGDEKQELCAQIDQLQKDLDQAKSECEEIKVSLEKSKEAAAEANAQLQDATLKLERSMNDGRGASKRLDELESENKRLSGEVSSMEMKLRQENEQHIAAMSEKDHHLRHMSQVAGVLEGKIGEMQSELKSYQGKLENIPRLEETIRELTSSLVQSEDKYSTLQMRLKDANAKLDESEQRFEGLEKKCKALQIEQSEREDRERSFTSNASKREREQIDTIHRLKKEKSDQVVQMERLQEEAAKIKTELAQSKEEAKKSKDQLRTALQSLDEMMKYIDGMKEESDDMMKALESETEVLMKRISVLEKHREFDQQTIKMYENEKDDRTRTIQFECQRKAEDELRRLRSDHDQEIADVKSRYEIRIKELQGTIEQRSEIAKSMQQHGSSEVSNLMKKVGEMTEKHSKDLRALREKYEVELSEESAAKNSLKVNLRALEARNEELQDALKLAESKSTKSTSGDCDKCDSIGRTLKETEQACEELKTKLQELSKNELLVRGELAQSKQLMSITQANEKLLEDHVASLEAQIDTLVADYESKLGGR